jgi:hypothetical protein
MTTNAYIFSWCRDGVEAIVPVSQYEYWEDENLIRRIKGLAPVRNPLYSIIQHLILRAKFNSQRFYEIYAIDCDPGLDEKFWREQWQENPQFTADLIRERGHKIYSDRQTSKAVIT